MEVDIGMSRTALRKFAQDILESCDANGGEGEGINVTRYIKPNGPGEEMTLTLNNDDMENRDDLKEDEFFYEITPD